MNKSAHGIDILLVSSPGGHLVQMNRIFPSLKRWTTVLVTSAPEDQVPTCLRERMVIRVVDANQKTPLRAAWLFLHAIYIAIKTRPKIVISTGACPGVAVICACRILLNAKCIWVDSLANATRMSLSGRLVRHLCIFWLSQWEDVAEKEGANYFGKVI